MELQELAKQSLLKNGEVFVAGVLNDVYDPAFVKAKESLKASIPGSVDDAIIDMIAGVLQPSLKEILLAEVAKIHKV